MAIIATVYSENGTPASERSLRMANLDTKSSQSAAAAVSQGRRASFRAVAPAPSPSPSCDACPHCSDVCSDEKCMACREKTMKRSRGSQQYCSSEPTSFTMCEIRRHAHENSAWLVAGKDIYDATEYMTSHPGGSASILRKAGGVVDVSADLNFHSKNGRKQWEKYKIGTVRPCGEENKPFWMFWK